ncbi:MAG: hypothetical protein A2711_10815 [Burkholderiales bacterium RIFCSPHIGHO2_01_FULL_63_240]|jgi:iron complex outermembrane recepter protein|nr:MAG: hypothetical protein A2711_10815 [Burkholderiales bacterium RIFCSPHIGHO2_01_FULL_63_240]
MTSRTFSLTWRHGASAVALAAQTLLNAHAAPLQVDLPAQPLERSLAQLARQAGLQLMMPAEAVGDRRAARVNGSLELSDALAQLLMGTRLRGRVEGNTLLIEPIPAHAATSAEGHDAVLPAVQVTAQREPGTAETAYAAKSATVGVLGSRSLKDTPYTIEVYTRELLENRQARSLADATRGDAAVSLSYGDLVTENNGVAIRGINPDFYTGSRIDGMTARVRASDLPLEHFESVEVLKGAGAFLYGFGAPGGVVNYALKRPTDEPLRRLSTQVMDSGLFLVHGDIGGRLGESKAFGYRINVVDEEGDTYINGGRSRRNSGSLAVDWRLTPDITWRADALVADHKRRGGYWALVPNGDGLANNWSAGAPPAAIDGSRRLAPSFTSYSSSQETYGTQLDWRFDPDWSLSVSYRSSENGRQFLAPAIFASPQGDYKMRFWNYANRFSSTATQALVMGKLQTGEVRHDVVLGASSTRTRSANITGQSAVIGEGNLANPVDFTNPFSHVYGHGEANKEYDLIKRRELFASDTLHLGADWDVILGLRHGELNDRYTKYKRSANTPTIAVVFRPINNVSVYASYVEALEEGSTAPETALNAGQVFPPLKSKQIEVGAKTGGRDWTASAALFHLRRGQTFTSADNVFSQDGESRYQGIELSGKARLSRQWLATASYLWLDATSQKTTKGELDGKKIPGIAKQQVAGYAEYRVTGLPLILTAGARYVGKQPLDPNGRWNVSSVTLLDAGARYESQFNGLPLIIRLNVDNLANKAYWVAQAKSTSLMQGAPRTVKLGAQIDF